MKCPNCGGTLYFNIADQDLKCEHCGSTFDPAVYQENNSADEYGEEIRVYTCRNCGAELLSLDEEAVTYCSYCGSEAVLSGKLKDKNSTPHRILPFKITKEKCKQIYQEEVRKKWFVPKEFRDPEFVEKFRGIYIPYWMYRVRFRSDPIEIDGYKSFTRDGYDYYNEYKVKAEIKNRGLYGIPYDASRNFDDRIAEEIAPFQKKDLRGYHPGFLAGMYADLPNVPARTYQPEVLRKATDSAIRDITDSLNDINPKLPKTQKGKEELLDARYDGEDAIFLPVWFLTWRKNDRVAYAIINGQTGKMHIDLPIDTKRFFLNTLLTAAVLFGLLTAFLSATSRFVLAFSSLLVCMSTQKYRQELRDIRDAENHVFDKGYLITDDDELLMSEKKREQLRRQGRILRSDLPWTLLFAMLFTGGFGVASGMYDLLVSPSTSVYIIAFFLIWEGILFLRTLDICRHLKKKISLFICFAALAAVGFSFGVVVMEPVYDWWYYLAGLLSLAAASWMCVDLIQRYYEVSTRPLPSFYSREGGNDNA